MERSGFAFTLWVVFWAVCISIQTTALVLICCHWLSKPQCETHKKHQRLMCRQIKWTPNFQFQTHHVAAIMYFLKQIFTLNAHVEEHKETLTTLTLWKLISAIKKYVIHFDPTSYQLLTWELSFYCKISTQQKKAEGIKNKVRFYYLFFSPRWNRTQINACPNHSELHNSFHEDDSSSLTSKSLTDCPTT